MKEIIMAGQIDKRLAELGIDLPDAPAPAANYLPWVITGNLVMISGQIPMEGGKLAITGTVGDGTVTEEDAIVEARKCAINLLANLKTATGGDLDKVKRVVKLGGFVASQSSFTMQPKVINAASDLMVEVFGDAGRHARFAVGASALPLGCVVEIEGIFEISS
jgi:enamine deaminase RidA (YjgF/YER057c/UK114 family)